MENNNFEINVCLAVVLRGSTQELETVINFLKENDINIVYQRTSADKLFISDKGDF